MKKIIIKYIPFTFDQVVYIKEIETDEDVKILHVKTDEISKFISETEDIEEVHLYGNEKIIKNIRKDCLTKYRLHNIDFYINN